jgi:hypothetical protein
MMETVLSSEAWVLTEPHGVTSQKTAFFVSSLVENFGYVNAVVIERCL